MKKIIAVFLAIIILTLSVTACNVSGTRQDESRTVSAANKLQSNQPTPSDIDYSLERYNLIRRAYWVNGQREKANALPCQIEKPLGYVVLFSANTVVGNFIVDGKVSSLNSFLTPDYQYFGTSVDSDGEPHNGVALSVPRELADIDGSYGENDDGIFFFTPDGKYIEWTGDYLYSDIPFEVSDPVVNVAN